jgi:hypothetical protein
MAGVAPPEKVLTLSGIPAPGKECPDPSNRLLGIALWHSRSFFLLDHALGS